MRLKFSGIFLTVAASFGSTAWAANHTVQLGIGGALTFTPSSLTIKAGDTVTFTSLGGFHNVASNPGTATTFRCGPNGCDGAGTGNGEPGSGEWSQTVAFPTPGTIGYFCEVHDQQGMTGSIQVDPVPVTLQSFDVD